MSDLFPTPTNLDEAVLAAEFSQQNVEFCGVTCTPSGYFYCHGKRIGLAKAEAIVAQHKIEQEATTTRVARQSKRTGFTWNRLNQATRDLFYKVGLVIEQQEDGHGAMLGVVLHIPSAEAPRLTNLKKAGLLKTVEGVRKSHRILVLTAAGKAQMEAGC